ncbi:MAG: DUF1643 domain-containing protein [Cyanobacteria bacterium P01_G01_bin.54]
MNRKGDRPTTIMHRHAVIDPTGQYRYHLSRIWNLAAPRIAFVMLNPSQADAHRDDPTLRRCLGFAQAWGFGALAVVNLFAYRTAQPKVLQQVADPIGPENDRYLKNAVCQADCTVVAWGNQGVWRDRTSTVLATLQPLTPIYCLGMTQQKQPRHPLYLPSNTQLQRYYPRQ